MTIKVQLLPQTPVVAGQARLLIERWQGGTENLVFTILRAQDDYYLQEGKEWGSTAVWFPISLTENAKGQLEGLIGPDVLDPILESSGNATYELSLQQGAEGEVDRGTVRMGGGLFGSQASGSTASTRETANIVQPIAEPTIKTAEPIVEPIPEAIEEPAADDIEQPIAEPEPQAKVKKKGIKPLFIVLAIVLLLLIAAGAAWILLKPSSTPVEEVTEQDQAPDTTCSVAGLENQNELSFVQNCIQQEMSSEQLLTVINGAKAAEQCGVAQRLYANRAQSGDVTIALAYAKEYDPKFHQTNSCFSPDNATASYWYETVLGIDPDNQLAQERLEVLDQ